MKNEYVESEMDDLLLIEDQDLENTLDFSKELSLIQEGSDDE